MVNNKSYKNGHELISAMQKEKNLTYWIDTDLLSFIREKFRINGKDHCEIREL